MREPKASRPALCKWCSEPSHIKQGRIWLCVKHYRFSTMRSTAKRFGKIVPSYQELEVLLSDTRGLVCKDCNRQMNWLSREGQSTVVSLQHYRSGKLALVCRACNTRHAKYKADTFCELPKDSKRCPSCGEIKKLSEFKGDFSGRWANRKTYCVPCSNKKHRDWVDKNREYVNAKQREYRASHQLA